VPADQLSSAFPGSRDKGADGFLRSNYKSAGQFCQQSGVRDAAVPNVSRPAGRGGGASGRHCPRAEGAIPGHYVVTARASSIEVICV
jgi:hypothetical protein